MNRAPTYRNRDRDLDRDRKGPSRLNTFGLAYSAFSAVKKSPVNPKKGPVIPLP